MVVWTDPDLDRWSLVSLWAKVSGCGAFLLSPQLVVPDSLSGVDLLSPALPVVSSREFRPESSDTTGLQKLRLRGMSAAGIDVSGKLPFLRETFRLELLARSGRDAQLLPHMLKSLASVEL